jgi:hypothetical protein
MTDMMGGNDDKSLDLDKILRDTLRDSSRSAKLDQHYKPYKNRIRKVRRMFCSRTDMAGNVLLRPVFVRPDIR